MLWASHAALCDKLIVRVSAMDVCNWEQPLPESRDIVTLGSRGIDVSRREELTTLDEQWSIVHAVKAL